MALELIMDRSLNYVALAGRGKTDEQRKLRFLVLSDVDAALSIDFLAGREVGLKLRWWNSM